MTGLDENKEVIDEVTRLWDMPKEERLKEALKMQVATYLTVKSHDEILHNLPCQNNGFLRFMAAAGSIKRGVVIVGAAIFAILTLIGAAFGVVSYLKH